MGRVRAWLGRVRQRLGRFLLLLVNLVIVPPLLIVAWQAGIEEGITGASSVLGEVGGLMSALGALLVLYLIWLSFGPRRDIVSEVRDHSLIPIALLFALYLLDALVSTADGAALDAELLMSGLADASIAVEFSWADDVGDLIPATDLILVTMRNGNYYVVERQAFPPSGRPVAYVVPFDSVEAMRLQRLNEADAGLEQFMVEMMASPVAP